MRVGWSRREEKQHFVSRLCVRGNPEFRPHCKYTLRGKGAPTVYARVPHGSLLNVGTPPPSKVVTKIVGGCCTRPCEARVPGKLSAHSKISEYGSEVLSIYKSTFISALLRMDSKTSIHCVLPLSLKYCNFFVIIEATNSTTRKHEPNIRMSTSHTVQIHKKMVT